MTLRGGPSQSRRWTVASALLGGISLICLIAVAGDFLPTELDNDEFRVPVGAVSFLTWLGGLVAATVAVIRARRDGERARWAVAVGALLLAGAALVVVVIWAIASAGLN
jgi:O-antigen/teichoic acid export membrane protein